MSIHYILKLNKVKLAIFIALVVLLILKPFMIPMDHFIHTIKIY